MPITPDQKDWTWVLTRPCPECGFDASAFPFEDLPRLLLENAERWPAVLARPAVRVRPDTAVEDRYGEQDPEQVSAELVASARLLADAFAAVPTVALRRTGLRSDGSRFTVETLGRYLLHDPVHHLHDVRG
jgi:hypothetical protein